jgi:MFS superfamily sulfate permease-like transporter
MINFPVMKKLINENKKKFVYLLLIGFLFILRDPTQGVLFGMFVFYIEFQKNIIVPQSEFLKLNELENLNLLFCDQNKVNKNDKETFIVYRIIGILNSQNVDLHCQKIYNFLIENNNRLCICLRYTYLKSKDVYEQIKTIAETLKMKKDLGNEFFPILVVGISIQEVVICMGSDWLFYMNKQGVSFM